MNASRLLARLASLLALAATSALYGADGVIFYNRVRSATSPITLGRVNADGTGVQDVGINLPSAMNPTVSRNGRLLLVTSSDPGRPFKVSQNVYVIDLLTGNFGRATSYQDEVVLGGVRFADDLARFLGNNTISSYKINYPYYKALSPDGSRVVVMNQFKAGVITLGTPLGENDIQPSSERYPIIDVYNLADALPAGPYVFLAAQPRDGFNQGGDGVDWHPVLNEVVAAVSSDVPVVGNGGRTSMEGTVLAVFSTTSISPFLRKLTTPVGQFDAFFDVSTFVSTAVGPHDYAPAISPNGTRVAFVRHFLRQDTRFDGAGIAPLPAICSLRVVDYNGANEREVLRMAEGWWVTKLAWSPDESELAFDLAPQVVLNGFNSLMGDPSRSEIYSLTLANGNVRHLVAPPASFPTWSPLGFPLEEAPTPTLRITKQGDNLLFLVGNLVAGRGFAVDRSIDLQNWAEEYRQLATASEHSVVVNPALLETLGLFRARIL
ncbi:MAG TPA: hypothetical protein PLX89_09605 [Verrucomicrobiota bacterium]|nr:hypothetical protein [Verrucomicrobiales bacterium]HRI13250.1 hypothetical protein [Verrucomicrobiota bacterium]